MNLLDAILRETQARRESRPDRLLTDLWPTRLARKAEIEERRSRLASLADRSGPKGALAGHLDELLRLS